MPTNSAWIYDERIAIILGYATLILAVSLFFSCRIFTGFLRKRGLQRIVDHPVYSKFYSLHGTYWWFFTIILTVHFLTAFGHVGIPQSSDPDSPVHWSILATGLAGSVVFAGIYFSCRSIGTFWSFFTDKSPSQLYPSFFKKHSYIWLLFGTIILTHIVIAFHHVGIWPPLR
jgi:hypothetical protein